MADYGFDILSALFQSRGKRAQMHGGGTNGIERAIAEPLSEPRDIQDRVAPT